MARAAFCVKNLRDKEQLLFVFLLVPQLNFTELYSFLPWPGGTAASYETRSVKGLSSGLLRELY